MAYLALAVLALANAIGLACLALAVRTLVRRPPPGHVPSLSSTWPVVDTVIAERLLPSEGLILDLGCNDGRTLRRLARAGLRGPLVGYEYKFWPWLSGWLWNRLRPLPIELRRADFSEAPIGQAKGIYLFLLSSTLGELAPRLESEAEPGTVVVSAEFAVPGWEPERVFEARGITSRRAKIFVYRLRGLPKTTENATRTPCVAPE